MSVRTNPAPVPTAATRCLSTGRNARLVLHLTPILDRVIKKWGYEYILVASGAALGLLIVLVVGFEDPPMPPPDAPAVAAAVPSSPPAPPPTPTIPRQLSKSTDVELRQAPAKPVLPPASQAPTPESAKDAPAWRRFAAVHGPVLGRRMIAVIIDDMGLDRKNSARAMRLPGPLTMSFLTYARSVKAQAAAARKAGHEIMIHVPMEADDSGTYAGPKAIRRGLSEKELARRLDWALSRLDRYVGINNHMGSGFTADAPGMALVLAEIRRRGLLFIDSRTSPRSVGAAVARRLAVPFAARDVFLDDGPSGGSIEEKLKELEQAASANGYAIAIGHPREATLSALETWLPTLASRGFVLVPVSAVVGRKQQAG